MKLRVIDLFAGIAGFTLGLHRTGGYETVGFCEMKPHARAVLAKNFPGVPCHDDVTTYPFKEGEADVITAGFPCQDISFAGDGAGLAGARSGLYREVIRALRVVRPLYAILENVAALLSRGLDVVLGDMAEIGYDAEWHCIPASAVGAPHRRDRIWIVANPERQQGSERHGADLQRRRQGEAEQAWMGGYSPLSGFLAEALANPSRGGYGSDDGLGQDPSQAGTHQGEGHQWERLRPQSWGGSETLANTKRVGQSRQGEPLVACYPEAHGKGKASHAFYGGIGHQWAIEPDVGRVAHGVPNRVDRLAELGNAVVPQIPEIIGRAIQARIEQQQRAAA